jgi:hypothetical protein
LPPEPQPELVLLPLGHRFVILLLEEPVAFIEDVDEADIVDEPLALVVFERPRVVFCLKNLWLSSRMSMKLTSSSKLSLLSSPSIIFSSKLTLSTLILS